MVTLSLLILTTYFGNTYSTKLKIFTQTNRYLLKKPGGNIAILLISCLHGCICNKKFQVLDDGGRFINMQNAFTA